MHNSHKNVLPAQLISFEVNFNDWSHTFGKNEFSDYLNINLEYLN